MRFNKHAIFDTDVFFNLFYNMIRITQNRLVLALVFLCATLLQSQVQNNKPIFKNGEAQVIPEFSDASKWIIHDLWVETTFDTDGDGQLDRMHVSVTRPFQTETEGLKLPIVYNSSPYFAGVAPFEKDLFWDVNHELGVTPPKERTHFQVERVGERPYISKQYTSEWVPRGYVVVHSSAPGTGLSDGAPTLGGSNEFLAPKAVIDWLCGRAKGYTERHGSEEITAYWSTGKVGMIGVSYNGTLCLAAATTGVEGLEAIIPIAPNTSYYHYYRSNGLVRSPGGYEGEDIDVLYDFIHSGEESKRDYNNRFIRDSILVKGMDRVTGDYNDFWAKRDYLNHMDGMKAALLMSHGFNDWNVMPEHSYRIYKAAKERHIPSQIFYHQRGHGGAPPMKMMNRWFTRYLHGIKNNVEEDPRSWIVREGKMMPTPYPDYPNPKASYVKMHLNSGGLKKGRLTIEKPKKRQGKESLVDDYNILGEDLAKSEESENRLLFVSSALKDAVHISGEVHVNIRLACSKPAANLSVWLVSLPWDDSAYSSINSNVISRGWADPQNHKSITESVPLKPGKFYNLSFNLMPDDQVIPKGQNIGLMIFSSDKEYTLHPKPGTELTIDLNKTTIDLPVVGGVKVLEKAISK